jgi:hypothetical protein
MGRMWWNNYMALTVTTFKSTGFFIVGMFEKCGVCYYGQQFGRPTAVGYRWMPGHLNTPGLFKQVQ